MHISGGFEFELEEALSEAEELLKNHHFTHPELQLDVAHTIKKSEHIVKNILKNFDYGNRRFFSDILLESNFLRNGINAAFSMHIRYIPATIHRHTFFEVSYLLSGSCTHYTGTQTLELKAGDILVVAPNTNHAVSVFSDDCIMMNLLLRQNTFEKDFLDILTQKDIIANFFTKVLYGNEKNTFLLFHIFDDNVVKTIFMNAYAESLHSSRYQEQLLNSIIQLFFIQLLKRHEKDVVVFDDQGSETGENIIFILRYIQEHYQTVSLSELSSFFGYSQRHLRRMLQQHTGAGFNEIIQQMRMQHAQDLLRHSTHTVSNIASMVGYSDPSYFRQVFKKHFGVTPSEYVGK